MVDAATGGRAVFGRAIEKVYLGVPQGSLEFLNFDSVDIARLDAENKSNAITGHEGADKGTPADIKFQDKLKYAMTPSRFLFDCVAAFGKPDDSDPVGGGILEVGNFALTASGATGYTTGQVVTVTDAGGGEGAVVHVVASAGAVTGITIVAPGGGYVTPLLDFSGIGDGDATGTITASPVAWLVKIRPQRSNEVRGASMYLYEGGDYSASLQVGRRAKEMSIADGANKRSEVTTTYSDPTGDTITGFGIGKSSNANAYWQEALLLKAMTRGRRPYDSNFDAGKSFFLKCTAVSSDKATFVSKYDTASGATDGSNFPGGSYGTHEIIVTKVGSTSFAYGDGYYATVDEEGEAIGLFGENFEAFEVTFGAGSDFDSIAVNDQFEFPVAMPALTKSVVAESRLSAFHLLRKIGGTNDIRIDKGTTKIERPYKEYRANGKRIPQAIDPTGDSSVTFTFSKRLFDRYFRAKSDAHTRFSVLDVYQVGSPITGSAGTDPAQARFESVQIYAPQCAVTALKSGDIATKDVLEETVTLMAEQPDAAPSAPAGFDSSADFPFQINIVTTIDPSWLS